MKIESVEFLKSVTENNELDFIIGKPKPELCFVGRSNVGKSSLLNSIFNSRTLVKTSSKPGHTKCANIFLVNKKFHFVDLPGYGFAKLNKENREKIDSLITNYIAGIGENIKKVVMILDAKVGATQNDIDMLQFLQDLKIPVIVVINKIDKLNSSELNESLKNVEKSLFGQKIIPYSTKTKKNHDKLLQEIFDI